MAVTIKDIAKVAGVSHTTVSRALREHPAISDKTTHRIKQLAAELGYVPSAAARGLKTSRSQVLGVIVRRIVDPFFAEVLQGIEDVLHAAGYSLFLAASHRDSAREQKVLQAMGERRVDGVIISSAQIRLEQLRQLNRFDIPFVLINNQALDEPDIYSVYHDDEYGSRELVQYLLDLGHKRIAYLGNSRGGRTNAKRLAGYKNSLKKASIQINPDFITSGPHGIPEAGAQGMQRFLDLTERPTAIVCYNDLMAIGAMRAIQQAGLNVPGDISVTGFDNIELAAYVTPALTTFNQPKYELGSKAATMMLSVLNDEMANSQSDVQVLRGKLVPRQSTSKPSNF